MTVGALYTIEMPDAGRGACCDGSAFMGAQYCTCWTPVYDMPQQPVTRGEKGLRGELCHDCAYKPGSPERQGDPRYTGDGELLDGLVETGTSFFCHQGIRRIVKLAHPSGAEVEVPPGDYRPPIVDGVPYKADGTPGELCAGWAARRLHLLQQGAKAS